MLNPDSCPCPCPTLLGQPAQSPRAPTFVPTLRVLGASRPSQESLDTHILESYLTTVVSFPLSSPWVLGMLLLPCPQSLRAAVSRAIAIWFFPGPVLESLMAVPEGFTLPFVSLMGKGRG
uniref:Uncharacterized protein n=1 Tax=Sus scrofa TaxID=9823 RepID=A0A8D1HD36_PIG